MKRFKLGERFQPVIGGSYMAILPDGSNIPVVAVESDGQNVCNRCVFGHMHSILCTYSCPDVFYVSAEEYVI